MLMPASNNPPTIPNVTEMPLLTGAGQKRWPKSGDAFTSHATNTVIGYPFRSRFPQLSRKALSRGVVVAVVVERQHVTPATQVMDIAFEINQVNTHVSLEPAPRRQHMVVGVERIEKIIDAITHADLVMFQGIQARLGRIHSIGENVQEREQGIQ